MCFVCFGFCHQVKKQLFGLDNRGMGAEVAVKNELRRTIKVSTTWIYVGIRTAYL